MLIIDIFSGYLIPYIYLVDMATDYGISESQAVFLLSIMGISNTVSRVVFGWIADRPWTNPLIVFYCANIIGGATTICCPWMETYAMLGAYSVVFGITVGAYFECFENNRETNGNCTTIPVY